MRKKKISKKKNIFLNAFLLCLGLLIGLILTECILHAYAYLLYHRSFDPVINDDVFTIVTLGESTTANLYNGQSSWPYELQLILNNGSSKKIIVHNAAIPGTDTNEILAQVPAVLDMYNPDLVIAMVGINDYQIENSTQWINRIKIYNLIHFVFESSQKEKCPHTKSQLRAHIKLLAFEQNSEDFDKKLQKLLLCKSEYDVYIELGLFYQRMTDFETAEKYYLMAQQQSESPLIWLGWLYLEQGALNNAKEIFGQIIERQDDPYAYIGLGMVYLQQSEYVLAENAINKALQIDPNIPYAYAQLIDIYQKNGDRDKYYNATLQLSYVRNASYTHTQNNVVQLKNILEASHTKLILMQYPTLSTDKMEQAYEDVIIISNEDTFVYQNQNEYNDLFIDAFAGTFGHTTIKGNKIIANNVAKRLRDDGLLPG